MPVLSPARSAALLAAGALAVAGLVAAAPSGAAAAPACGNSSLTVSATAEQGATGHANFVLLFRNRTGATCTLTGYPGLDALGTHHVFAHAQRTPYGFTGGSHHGVQTIAVAPGRYASADVEWMDFDPATGGACHFSVAVLATPANTSDTVRLARSVSNCSLQVHPTVAGTTGNS